jgi:hypothetical protein
MRGQSPFLFAEGNGFKTFLFLCGKRMPRSVWLDLERLISALQASPLVKLLHYKLKDANFAIGCQGRNLGAPPVLIRPHMPDFDYIKALVPEE